ATLSSDEFRQGLEFAVQSFEDIATLITTALNLTGQLTDKLNEYSQRSHQFARDLGQSLGIDPIDQVLGDFIGRRLGLEKAETATRLPTVNVRASALPQGGRLIDTTNGQALTSLRAEPFRPLEDYLAAVEEAHTKKF